MLEAIHSGGSIVFYENLTECAPGPLKPARHRAPYLIYTRGLECVASAMIDLSNQSSGCAAPTAHAAILVVDDDLVTLEIVAAVLTQSGFAVCRATNGVEAFTVLETTPGLDLMIIDLVLPGFDGLMLADMVKMRHPEMRIIYITGFPEVAERQPGYRYGPILRKPLVVAELAGIVRASLAEAPNRFGFRPDRAH